MRSLVRSLMAFCDLRSSALLRCSLAASTSLSWLPDRSCSLMVVSKLTPRSVEKLAMLKSIVNRIQSLETLIHNTRRACKFKTERPRFLGNSSPDGGNSCLAAPEYDTGYGVLRTTHRYGVKFDLSRAVNSTLEEHGVLYESLVAARLTISDPACPNPERLKCELNHALVITI
jgi:hypothetical protein